jgi:hypothetical protein
MAIFEILLCTDEGSVLVESGRETLLPGETWAFSGATGQLICGTVIQPSLGVVNYSASTKYDDCGDCLENTLEFFTANTAYVGCIICCPCDTGSTVNQVTVPHPTWTDNYGNPVVQANSVVLGGPNGLNS